MREIPCAGRAGAEGCGPLARVPPAAPAAGKEAGRRPRGSRRSRARPCMASARTPWGVLADAIRVLRVRAQLLYGHGRAYPTRPASSPPCAPGAPCAASRASPYDGTCASRWGRKTAGDGTRPGRALGTQALYLGLERVSLRAQIFSLRLSALITQPCLDPARLFAQIGHRVLDGSCLLVSLGYSPLVLLELLS